MKFNIRQLEELVSFLSNPQIEKIGEKLITHQRSHKTVQLLDRIVARDYNSEEELKAELCRGDHQDTKFKYLQNNLGKKLVDTLITSATTRDRSYRKIYDECYKQFATFKVLKSNGIRNTAIGLAIDVLKVARRYEITELVYLLSFEIARHFAMTNDSRKRTYYHKIYKRYFSIYQAEQYALIQYSDLSLLLQKSKKLQPQELKEVQEIILDIYQTNNEVRSYKLNFLRYSTAIIGHQLRDDHDKVVTTAINAIEYLDKLPFPAHSSYYFNFFYYMIPTLICKKDFNNLDILISRCLEMSAIGTHNWNISLFNKIVYGIHSSQYQIALDAFKQAMKYKQEIPENIIEQWRIIEAYLYLLSGLEKLPENKTRFRIQKFINDVPEYSKDKAGANVTILTLQVLLLLLRNKRGRILDRMDALKMYTYKYLVRDNTYRSQCFIKIILQLERSHFHPVAFKRHAAPLLKKMQEMPLRFSDLEVEIIPYERQYEFILQLLER